MSCILMLAGGYALLAVTTPCDDRRCLRIAAPVGRMLTPAELPSADWIRIREDQPLLGCLAKPEN